MNEPTAPASATAPVPKKRSPVERAVVWIGIAALLAVLGWEWNARNGYQHSMANLEQAIENSPQSPFMSSQVNDHLSGYAVQSDRQHSGHRFITVQWPSLFKVYKLAIMIEEDGRVRSVETELPEYDVLPDLGAGRARFDGTEEADSSVPPDAAPDGEAPASRGNATSPVTETAAEPARE